MLALLLVQRWVVTKHDAMIKTCFSVLQWAVWVVMVGLVWALVLRLRGLLLLLMWLRLLLLCHLL
jgi:hypothetical protein